MAADALAQEPSESNARGAPLAESESGSRAPSDPSVDGGPPDAVARFAASVAYRGLGTLRRLVETRQVTMLGLSSLWSQVNWWTGWQIRRRSKRLGVVEQQLQKGVDRSDSIAKGIDGDADRTSFVELLRSAADGRLSRRIGRRPEPAVDLISTGVISGDVARVRVSRHHYDDAPSTSSLSLGVLVALSDARPSYPLHRAVASTAVTIVIGLLGSLVFREPSWLLHVGVQSAATAQVLDGKVEALVAVLLLVPGFSLTLIRFPSRTSISGRLRFAGRLQVYATTAGLLVWAGVVAATGTNTTSADQVAWAVWAGRGAFVTSAVCAIWIWLAWALHGRCHLKPKRSARFVDGRVTAAGGTRGADAHFDLRGQSR